MNLEAANQGALLDRKLRITALTVFVVRWPLKMKRRHGVGDIDRTMPGVIVRIVTDAGIVG